MLAGLCAELHVHLDGSAVVRQAVGRAVGGDGLVHGAEFLLYDAETVGYEFVGGSGDLVLVLDPVLVVAVDEHPEHILRPLGVDVTVVEVDDGGVLAVDVGAEAAAAGPGGVLRAGVRDQYGPAPLCLVGIFGLGYEDLAERGVGGVAVCGRDILGLDFVAAARKLAESYRGRVHEVKRKAGAGIDREVQELDLHGQAAAVDRVEVAYCL